uniref:Sjoegren syndrome nuclear autoantigen 1 n=1 Tax=Spermophilus dauricus TaxID=99837 RepID=A0A8C9P5J4_SPEDA
MWLVKVCLVCKRIYSFAEALDESHLLGTGPQSYSTLFHVDHLTKESHRKEKTKVIPRPVPKQEPRLRQQRGIDTQKLHKGRGQLTEKLARVNENLARKIASRNEFDRTIAETEAAYLKILESSQTLLSVLKREAGNLTKATASDQKSSGGKDS